MHIWTFFKRRCFPNLLLLLLIGMLVDGMGNALHNPTSQALAAGSLEQTFAQAALDFKVPAPLLKAICYLEGRLSNHGGTPSVDQGYGCMHLLANQHHATLIPAARALNRAPDALKTSLTLNIRGGAAVLHAYQQRLSPAGVPGTTLSPHVWSAVLVVYSGAGDANIAAMYVHEIYHILHTGFIAMAETGERVILPPQAVSLPALASPWTTSHMRNNIVGALGQMSSALPAIANLPKGCVNDGQTDYPGAIDCIVKPKIFDCNRVKDNAPCTYESALRPVAYPVDFVVIHDVEGTAWEAINTFHDVHNGVSSHYVVDTDGTIYQLVHDSDIAYHAGNYWYNQHAIGIEHAGYAENGYQWFNATQYLASARLTAYLLNKFHLPLDRTHVIGHGDIPAPSLSLTPNHTDPGPYWLWDYYFKLINQSGIPYTQEAFNPTIITAHPMTDLLPLGTQGQEAALNYNFIKLYNGPSTASGQIPQAPGDSILNETGNVEPGISYAYTNFAWDAAGSGQMMYQIWYGTESHLHGDKPGHLASARLVWLALKPQNVSHGIGIALSMGDAAKIYSKPTLDSDYQIGDAPPGALFVSGMTWHDPETGDWYEINFNHRQGWISEADVAF
ncbi:N-acetylmuramoyl-L-alanine amidase [Dictyobacter arantiisoli]|uniref:N-acetylmuramoyl-L-alanine amidase n=1 Tax=Dictyobacter arantiisoli TaxID=2014874 RepID=A0A5A5T6S3_9CHLR|nr:peptidoglycan recognition family protein [Dictyobacter arantiisoli]GCF07181.1 amidase [Dictyobacter arantiisoli]